MLKPMALILALAMASLWPPGGAVALEAKKVAFFGILLIDTSPGEPDEAAQARRQEMEARLVEALAASERYEFVDISSVEKKAALYTNLAHCNGCDAQLAAELGADIALSGEVQKTSNLILSVSIYMRDAKTGELVGGGSADMRGNTDESWSRAINYILKNRILK